MRHYTNLTKTKQRLGRLLALARFSSFRKSRLFDAVPHSTPPAIWSQVSQVRRLLPLIK
jgi:hypothetical protein